MALSDAERSVVKEAIALIERETAEDGDTVLLKGFGRFTRKVTKPRVGHNPKTGAPVNIPSRSKLAFSAAAAQTRDA